MEPLVSISCITFNHEKYIGECLDGILMQKTTFPFEILIHDDASRDNTAKIIREYQSKYPKVIKPIYQAENQYSKGQRGMNIKYNFPRAKGKYIALCEGDDYWTDPLKLQKQVDFLEMNKDFIIHAGNAKYNISNSEMNGKVLYHSGNNTFNYSDFITRNNLATCTVLFRNIPIRFPEEIFKVTFGDWFLYFLLTKSSNLKAYRGNEVYAYYRVHDNGIMSKLDKHELISNRIDQVKCILNNIENELEIKEARNFIDISSVTAFNQFLECKKYKEAVKIFRGNFETCGLATPFRRYIREILSSRSTFYI